MCEIGYYQYKYSLIQNYLWTHHTSGLREVCIVFALKKSASKHNYFECHHWEKFVAYENFVSLEEFVNLQIIISLQQICVL